MQRQSDSVNIEQLRAQLDAIYTPANQSAVETHEVIHIPEFEKPEFNDFDIRDLTERAKFHTPNYEAVKAERMVTFGQYIESLRVHKLGSR